MKFIKDQTKTSKLEGWSFLSICNGGNFLTEYKGTEQKLNMTIKEEVTSPVDILAKLQPLLEEFKEINIKDLLHNLQPF